MLQDLLGAQAGLAYDNMKADDNSVHNDRSQ